MTNYVLCRSDTGNGDWSLHAPRSIDAQIANGDAPPLVSGPSELDEDDEWDRPDTRDYAAADVKSATNLHDLLASLQSLEALIDDSEEDWQHVLAGYDIDICELPNFGGAEPTSTLEIWSWDTDSLLVGTGPFAEWRIVDREMERSDRLPEVSRASHYS